MLNSHYPHLPGTVTAAWSNIFQSLHRPSSSNSIFRYGRLDCSLIVINNNTNNNNGDESDIHNYFVIQSLLHCGEPPNANLIIRWANTQWLTNHNQTNAARCYQTNVSIIIIITDNLPFIPCLLSVGTIKWKTSKIQKICNTAWELVALCESNINTMWADISSLSQN